MPFLDDEGYRQLLTRQDSTVKANKRYTPKGVPIMRVKSKDQGVTTKKFNRRTSGRKYW